MVFVPRLELTGGLLGLDTAVPRAVPADLLVALASRLVPADVVQKLLLAGVFLGAAAGAARLVPSRSTGAPLRGSPDPSGRSTGAPPRGSPDLFGRAASRAAAAALYAWNPFVYERLVMGHWGLLVSYAALPWVIAAAVAVRAAHPERGGRVGAARRLVATLAVAAFGSPAGGVIAAVVALCVVATPPWPPRRATPASAAGIPPARAATSTAQAATPAGGAGTPDGVAVAVGMARRAALVVGAALLVNAPWLVPSLLRPGGVPVRPAGAAAFAARPDGPLGTVGSLVGLGGIWNAQAVPPGLGSWPWLAGFAVVLAVAAAGLAPLLRRWEPEGSGEPRGGAPVDREGSGEPQGGAPVDREGSGEPQGGAPVGRAMEASAGPRCRWGYPPTAATRRWCPPMRGPRRRRCPRASGWSSAAG